MWVGGQGQREVIAQAMETAVARERRALLGAATVAAVDAAVEESTASLLRTLRDSFQVTPGSLWRIDRVHGAVAYFGYCLALQVMLLELRREAAAARAIFPEPTAAITILVQRAFEQCIGGVRCPSPRRHRMRRVRTTCAACALLATERRRGSHRC